MWGVLTSLEKGSLRMSRSVDFWYLRISLRRYAGECEPRPKRRRHPGTPGECGKTAGEGIGGTKYPTLELRFPACIYGPASPR